MDCEGEGETVVGTVSCWFRLLEQEKPTTRSTRRRRNRKPGPAPHGDSLAHWEESSDWFSNSTRWVAGDTPYIEEDGDQHVAEDVDARAGWGDDRIHCHDEWNGRTIEAASRAEDERRPDHPRFRMPATPAPAIIDAATIGAWLYMAGQSQGFRQEEVQPCLIEGDAVTAVKVVDPGGPVTRLSKSAFGQQENNQQRGYFHDTAVVVAPCYCTDKSLATSSRSARQQRVVPARGWRVHADERGRGRSEDGEDTVLPTTCATTPKTASGAAVISPVSARARSESSISPYEGVQAYSPGEPRKRAKESRSRARTSPMMFRWKTGPSCWRMLSDARSSIGLGCRRGGGARRCLR